MSDRRQATGGSTLSPVPAVARIEPYRVPRHPAPVDLYLDGNEGLPAPADLLAPLAGSDPELARRYPGHKAQLEERLARLHGVGPDQVLVTAGIDDGLDRTCRALLGPGRSMVMPVPTFEMLPRYAALTGGETLEVDWPAGPYPVDEVLAAARPDTTLVAVVTPNNPTGAVATADDLTRLSGALPGAALLLDLAYGEFADQDLTRAGLDLPRTLVFRTFSKAWGLAGLRTGYVLGPAELIGWLKVAGSPYTVAGPSLRLVAARLETGVAEVQAFVEEVRQERARLSETLRRLGCRPSPSQGNFVLAEVGDPLWVRDGLAALGIGVRLFTTGGTLGGQVHPALRCSVRITCPGQPAALARLESALAAVLAPVQVLEELPAPAPAQPASAPAQPEPVPAWVKVRTPEEARRARDLSLLAVAVREEPMDSTADLALLAAGCARVFDSTSALEAHRRGLGKGCS